MRLPPTIRRIARVPARLRKTRVARAVEAQVQAVRARAYASVRRVHVGCGPHHRLEGWHNVDIRAFPTVDTVMDVTRVWPFTDLEYVYAEHFLEHLELEEGTRFLEQAGASLRRGGILRLSTPNLDWVMRTHFDFLDGTAERRLEDTFRTNRAFHGWGHRFLYTDAMLRFLLEGMGFGPVRFFEYGVSDDPNLRGLERHGGYAVHDGHPSVVIVEATRGSSAPALPHALRERLERAYVRFVRAGH